MAHIHEEEPTAPTTLAKLIDNTTYTPGKYKLPYRPPAIDPELQLKWGLALLGEDKALEYLKWLTERIEHLPQ